MVVLTASSARLGKTDEAAIVEPRLLKTLPNLSAARMLDEDYLFAREEDDDFFVDGFRIAGTAAVCRSGG